jgi:nucleoside-diphosphate-sugar epimerase
METQPRRITWGVALRMGADALMIQISLLVAMALRMFYGLAFENPDSSRQLSVDLRGYLSGYAQNAMPLTIVVLAVFYLFGIYTYGRFYQGRYRALLVFQAVSQSYLIFAVANHFIQGRLPMQRSALVLAWATSSALIVGSRVWSRLWESIVHPERQERLSRRTGPGRQILVIGGAGYIGSALLEKLLSAGHRVRLLDLMVFGDEPISRVANHPNLEVVKGDFRHVENVVEALHGCDSVVHLGAIVGDPACNLDADLTIDVNLSATRMIGELAKAAGVERFVFASTCSVYGACEETLDERSVVKPISLYGQTKLASERILRNMATDRFTPTIVRFATIYGLSGRTRFDLVVNLLTAKAKIEGKITVFGGDQWRPFVHVDDAAGAVARLIEAPREIVANQIFNVGSDEQNYTITQVGELVHEQVVGAELLINKDDTDKRNYRVSFSKIRNQLGFEPKWTVEQGIQQVLEAIASGEVDNYQAAKYSNVKFLTEADQAAQVRGNWARELIENLQRE